MRRGRGFSRRPHLGGPDHTGELIGWGRFKSHEEARRGTGGPFKARLLGPYGGPVMGRDSHPSSSHSSSMVQHNPLIDEHFVTHALAERISTSCGCSRN
jgi:hypothetical protein